MELNEYNNIDKNTVLEENSETVDTIEKDTEKVKNKNTKKNMPSKEIVKCKVLNFNKIQHFVIISIDGCGVRIDDVDNDPGTEINIEVSGKIGTPEFKAEMKWFSMCRYCYSKISESTKKRMLYCNNENVKNGSENLCLCQRYCTQKGKYIEHNQDKRHCKYCID